MPAMTLSSSILIAALVWLFALPSSGQSGRQFRKLHYESDFQSRGWFFAPGMTWMMPSATDRQNTRISNLEQANDTLYSGSFSAGGRPGLYLGIGRHKFVDGYYFINHIDFGGHFKMLRGIEEFSGLVKADSMLAETQNAGRFSESFAGLFFRVSNIAQLGSTTWIHNSFGLNAEYRVISRRSYDGLSTGMAHSFPEAFQGQLHYRIGLGWKADPGLYFLLSAETPILNLYPFYDGKSTLPYFSTRYRPVILTLNVMFLDRTKSKPCENQPGRSSTQVDKENPGRNAAGDLFGPDVKRKVKRRRR
ncbi:MAG: hypothetical protein ACK5XV_05350 [Flavobacteriales bacterium]|jgi:hypothetical protein